VFLDIIGRKIRSCIEFSGTFFIWLKVIIVDLSVAQMQAFEIILNGDIVC